MKGSKRRKNASKEERVEPRFDSVFDVLYYDNRRIGSFTSQFNNFGPLQSLEKTETATEAASDESRLGVSVGPRSLRFIGGRERSTEETGTDSAKLIYDPLWTNAFNFLHNLQERDLISKVIASARIAQFILLKGRITLFDLGLLKAMWRIPEARENALMSEIARRPNDPRPTVERDINILFQMAEHLPHEAQCIFSCETGEIAWSLLRSEFLTGGSAADLGLRYGMGIDGEWIMLGILDALPGGAAESANTTTAAIAAIAHHRAGLDVLRVASIVRNLGRPEIAFGVTPLLIFRSVTG